MTCTLAAIIEQKQKEAAGWSLLHRVITEANLTPEEKDQIYDILGLSSPYEEDRFRKTAHRLGRLMTRPLHSHPRSPDR